MISVNKIQKQNTVYIHKFADKTILIFIVKKFKNRFLNLSFRFVNFEHIYIYFLNYYLKK